MGLVGFMPLGALYPSKSGLMNKHIVKHIVKRELLVSAVVVFLRLSSLPGSDGNENF